MHLVEFVLRHCINTRIFEIFFGQRIWFYFWQAYGDGFTNTVHKTKKIMLTNYKIIKK